MLSKHCLIGPLVFLELKQKKGHLLKDTKMVKYESPNHYKYKITIFLHDNWADRDILIHLLIYCIKKKK